MFVEFEAVLTNLCEVLQTVELHRAVPTQLAGILVLEGDGDPVAV